MSSKAPAAPAAPDPRATAQAQAEYNSAAARETAALNRVDQVTPQGSSRWRQTPSANWDENAYLAANPDVAGSGLTGEQHYARYGRAENRQGVSADYAPGGQWEQVTSYSPEQQRLYDQTVEGQTLYGDAALSQLRGVQDTLSQPFSYTPQDRTGQIQYAPNFAGIGDPNQSRDAVQEALLSRINPDLERDRAALENRLSNQGITMGSQAWNTGMQDWQRQANDARYGAILNAGQEQSRIYGLGMGQAQLNNAGVSQAAGLDQNLMQQLLALRAQPINEASALLSGAQVQNPQFGAVPQVQVQAPDYQAAVGQNYAGANSQWGASMQRSGQNNASMAGAGSAIASAGIMAIAI